jgi:proton-dependent oligopeptide transporter, POT family
MNNEETTNGIERTFLGHPRGLMYLFFSEMWERFCYYGMRGLLILYLTKTLLVGDTESKLIYGAYTALVYAAPVLGGRLADRYLGYKNAVILGGILMAIGEFLILGGGQNFLLLGMAAIIVGNGYFKANISTIVGKLYKDGDTRRDSGFTIFYMGINIGALLATTVVAEVGYKYGYEYGFALAGIGMIAGIIIFVIGGKDYKKEAAPSNPELLNKKILGPLTWFHTIVIGSVLAIPLLYILLSHNTIVGWLLAATAIYVVSSLIIAGAKEGKVWLHRMIALVIMMLLNVVFWACFEQAGTSLTLFADTNINRVIFGWEMGAATTQFFNPAFILLFGSIFSLLWVTLAKRGKNPNIPAKFGFGLIQLGLGYTIVLLGFQFVSPEYLLPLWTLVFMYMLHTTGELFISPIGLSMVTKLAPSHMTGTAMGGWFLSWAGANFVAAWLATLTGSSEEVGEVATTASDSLNNYVDVYSNMGFITIGVGLLVLILSTQINKLFHGVK